MVLINGTHSNPRPVVSGVPQGSFQGPVQFLLYINDITDNISFHVRLFTDSSVIYREINIQQDHLALQQDLDNLCSRVFWDWSSKFLHHPILRDFQFCGDLLTFFLRIKDNPQHQGFQIEIKVAKGFSEVPGSHNNLCCDMHEVITKPAVSFHFWRGFLETPKTFRANFGCHNFLRIFKTKTFLGMKFCSKFALSFLKVIVKAGFH